MQWLLLILVLLISLLIKWKLKTSKEFTPLNTESKHLITVNTIPYQCFPYHHNSRRCIATRVSLSTRVESKRDTRWDACQWQSEEFNTSWGNMSKTAPDCVALYRRSFQKGSGRVGQREPPLRDEWTLLSDPALCRHSEKIIVIGVRSRLFCFWLIFNDPLWTSPLIGLFRGKKYIIKCIALSKSGSALSTYCYENIVCALKDGLWIKARSTRGAGFVVYKIVLLVDAVHLALNVYDAFFNSLMDSMCYI